MEELQSTEILEREIMEDARKKALRILKAADDTIKSKTAEWGKKTQENIDILNKKYNKQKETAAEKIMARLPIDKLRLKIEKIEDMLQSAEDDWYKKLNRSRILGLLTNELSERIKFYGDFANLKQKYAYYYGLNRNETEEILKTVDVTCVMEETASDSRYPSIKLETEKVRITASIQRIVDYYIHVKRIELIESMVGSDFMENA